MEFEQLWNIMRLNFFCGTDTPLLFGCVNGVKNLDLIDLLS